MYNIFWKRSQSLPMPQVRLDGVWRVDADRTYHIRPSKEWEKESIVAIRTEKGAGTLIDSRGRNYPLPADSLIFLNPRQILEYWTDQSPWKFYWFEFQTDSGLAPDREVLRKIPFSAREKELIQQCYLNLGSAQSQVFLLSQSIFLTLLLTWLTASPDADGTPRHDLVAILERGGKRNLPIPQIAREAGMCQRSFRSEIRRLTGYSPTEYLTKMKMDTAMEMLCATDQTIGEISDSLNFGNAFYFSRVFRQHFGIAPGQARKGFSSK